MRSAIRHRYLLRFLAAAVIATTLHGWLPVERPKRKLRMADASPVSETIAPQDLSKVQAQAA